jgi:hypothetical protein
VQIVESDHDEAKTAKNHDELFFNVVCFQHAQSFKLIDECRQKKQRIGNRLIVVLQKTQYTNAEEMYTKTKAHPRQQHRPIATGSNQWSLQMTPVSKTTSGMNT